MRIFGDDKYSGRRKDKYKGDRRSNNSRPQMYDAVCDKCGKDCKVPFKPSNDKPIYCSECFEEEGGGNSRGRSNSRRDYGRNSRSRDREMFSAICDDCGKECKVPFKPSSDKPIYCSDCFEKRGGNEKSNNGGNSKQLEEINEKLDKLLELLGGEEKKEIKPKKVKKEKIDEKEIEEEKEKTVEVVEDMINE